MKTKTLNTHVFLVFILSFLGAKGPQIFLYILITIGLTIIKVKLRTDNTISKRKKEVVKGKYYLKDYINTLKGKSNLPFLLGINGRPVVSDLHKLKHILIAGESGGGKSTMINAILQSLMYYNGNILYLLVDFKWVELNIYNKLNNTIFIEESNFMPYIDRLIKELDRRKKLICDLELQNIDQYNKIAFDKLCRIVFLIDEVADIKLANNNKNAVEIENKLTRILNQGRAFGVHGIFATQNPSGVQFSTELRTALQTKVSFAVTELKDQDKVTIRGTENLKEGEFKIRTKNGIEQYKGFYVDRIDSWEIFKELEAKLSGVSFSKNQKIPDTHKSVIEQIRFFETKEMDSIENTNTTKISFEEFLEYCRENKEKEYLPKTKDIEFDLDIKRQARLSFVDKGLRENIFYKTKNNRIKFKKEGT